MGVIRSPEGDPAQCPVCGNMIRVTPSIPTGDAPCPQCGHLVWWPAIDNATDPLMKAFQQGDIEQLRAQLGDGVDSLELVERIMNLEDDQ